MSKNPHYLAQVMEKIGSPLIASVNDVAARLAASGQSPAVDPAAQIAEDASKVAALLNKSTQVAISMSQMMDLSQSDEQADSVRLALTALAGPMLANQYRMSVRLPGDNDVKRIVTALEAVMTFSDNFNVAGDAQARLELIDKDFFPSDPAQVQISYIQALIPTVNAVVAFPFGQPERKLVQEITDRLIKKAQTIRQTHFGQMNDGPAKKCELAILRSLSTIYSQCHFGEMTRLMSLPPEKREQGAISLDPVWTAFEKRADLIEALSEAALPDASVGAGQGSQGSGGSGGLAAAVTQAPPLETSPAQAPAEQAQSEAPPPPQQTQEMPAQTAQQTQQAVPVKPPTTPPPPQAAQPPPPPQEAVDNSGQSGKDDSSEGNPMAFFKKSEG